MDQVELPILCLTHKRQLGNVEGFRQTWAQIAGQLGLHGRQMVRRQTTAQCDVKAELVHHIGVAPAQQLAQPRLALPGGKRIASDAGRAEATAAREMREELGEALAGCISQSTVPAGVGVWTSMRTITARTIAARTRRRRLKRAASGKSCMAWWAV